MWEIFIFIYRYRKIYFFIIYWNRKKFIWLEKGVRIKCLVRLFVGKFKKCERNSDKDIRSIKKSC